MTARTATVVGLALIAVAIGVQVLSGVDFPRVPPGLVIDLVVLALVVAVRHRWVFVLGVVWPVFLLVGAVATSGDRLGAPGLDGDFLGLVLELAAAALTIAGSLTALVASRPARVRGA